MIKVSLAVSALLSSSYAFNIKNAFTSKDMHQVTDSPQSQAMTMASAALGVSFKPESCWSGVERFERGPSNSLATWEANKDSDTKWEDPEFTPDDSSMSWSQFGYETLPEGIAQGLDWLRPTELPTDYYRQPPSLWGQFGKPLP